MTDPYRPFPAASRPAPAQFPRVRLERAGVPSTAVDELEAAFPSLPDDERAQLVQYVDGHSDAAILARFGEGPPPAPVTRETLEAETVDELEDRIRAWNEEHPDEHLAVSGRKQELVGRLLDAYASPEVPEPSPEDAAAQAAAAPAENGSTVAEGTVPTAPTPTTPEGAPTGTQAPAAAGDGTTTIPGGTS